MEIGERIRLKRKECGLTQDELAKKLGIKNSAVAKYENGRIENIKRSTIQKMAEIFNCSPTYLLGLDERAPSDEFALSDLEKQIILAYRKSDPIDKEMVLRILKIERKNDAEKLA